MTAIYVEHTLLIFSVFILLILLHIITVFICKAELRPMFVLRTDEQVHGAPEN